jgi:hypothetical protein
MRVRRGGAEMEDSFSRTFRHVRPASYQYTGVARPLSATSARLRARPASSASTTRSDDDVDIVHHADEWTTALADAVAERDEPTSSATSASSATSSSCSSEVIYGDDGEPLKIKVGKYVVGARVVDDETSRGASDVNVNASRPNSIMRVDRPQTGRKTSTRVSFDVAKLLLTKEMSRADGGAYDELYRETKQATLAAQEEKLRALAAAAWRKEIESRRRIAAQRSEHASAASSTSLAHANFGDEGAGAPTFERMRGWKLPTPDHLRWPTTPSGDADCADANPDNTLFGNAGVAGAVATSKDMYALSLKSLYSSKRVLTGDDAHVMQRRRRPLSGDDSHLAERPTPFCKPHCNCVYCEATLDTWALRHTRRAADVYAAPIDAKAVKAGRQQRPVSASVRAKQRPPSAKKSRVRPSSAHHLRHGRRLWWDQAQNAQNLNAILAEREGQGFVVPKAENAAASKLSSSVALSGQEKLTQMLERWNQPVNGDASVSCEPLWVRAQSATPGCFPK